MPGRCGSFKADPRFGKHHPWDSEQRSSSGTYRSNAGRHPRPALPVVTSSPALEGGASYKGSLVVGTLEALTRFRVELGHLERPLQLCVCCSPGGLATSWTRDFEEYLVSTPAE